MTPDHNKSRINMVVNLCLHQQQHFMCIFWCLQVDQIFTDYLQSIVSLHHFHPSLPLLKFAFIWTIWQLLPNCHLSFTLNSISISIQFPIWYTFVILLHTYIFFSTHFTQLFMDVNITRFQQSVQELGNCIYCPWKRKFFWICSLIE